MVQPDKPQTII